MRASGALSPQRRGWARCPREGGEGSLAKRRTRTGAASTRSPEDDLRRSSSSAATTTTTTTTTRLLGRGRFLRESLLLPLVAAGVFDLGLARGARGEEAGALKRPKSYTKLVRDITGAIRKTVELEAEGASMSEIRKSGDPVKAFYRELLTKYDSDVRVNKDPTFVSLTNVFLELGSFYRANGPNARLSDAVQASVLSKLDEIDAIVN